MRRTPDNTKTQDGTQSQTWEEWQREFPEQEAKPRLRILYHVELSRIGATSHPDNLLSTAEGQLLGRKEPLFVERAKERSLEDATISREQIVLRWLPSQEFEIEPCEGAKRKISLIKEDGTTTEITSKTLAPVGACVAIDDRVLIGLELVSKHHEPEEDRLGFVGESDETWKLRENISEIAAFRKPALILGQTGAGKELVANAIHQQGARAKGPFVTVNCAALPENLVESILFGHKKGAFTGADSNQDGMFRAADNGTLFLDELGEMPITVQPKLLRTLQDGLVFAVGHPKSTSVDVRFIAATNRDPKVEINAGRLREDLYHRLSGHVIRVPSLRERRFDIPELFVYFLTKLRADHPESSWLFEGANGWRRMIPMSFFIDLMRCEWTGNIRELENVAERTVRKNLTPGPFRSPELSLAETSYAPPSKPLIEAVVAIERPQSAPVIEAVERPTAHSAKDLAIASQALVLAHKTIAKIFSESALSQLIKTHEAQPETLNKKLEAAAAERLFEILAEHDFKQRNVAAALDMSPSTLIKLMQRFGLPRPTDLSAELIQEAITRANGDLDLAATSLNVSPQGLKKFLSTKKT